MIDSQKIRYLAVGGINTLVGYSIGVGAYALLASNLHIVLIGVLSNVFSISFSFLTYKLFVFRTRGNWFVEYMRAYLVYGGMAVVGIMLLWLFVEYMRLKIWLAQGLIIFFTVALSYIGHKTFTFRQEAH